MKKAHKGRRESAKDVKDKHGGSCMCRRCLGREIALIRKGNKLRLRDYMMSATRINEDD